MAMSSDDDIKGLVPDILEFGIGGFYEEHAKAQSDIEREIRSAWWNKSGQATALDPTLLVESQWTMAASYLVLWKYVLPELTNWTDEDRFQKMAQFYNARYYEEMAAVFDDGVLYDESGGGVKPKPAKDCAANLDR